MYLKCTKPLTRIYSCFSFIPPPCLYPYHIFLLCLLPFSCPPPHHLIAGWLCSVSLRPASCSSDSCSGGRSSSSSSSLQWQVSSRSSSVPTGIFYFVIVAAGNAGFSISQGTWVKLQAHMERLVEFRICLELICYYIYYDNSCSLLSLKIDSTYFSSVRQASICFLQTRKTHTKMIKINEATGKRERLLFWFLGWTIPLRPKQPCTPGNTAIWYTKILKSKCRGAKITNYNI